ncbi:MAG: methylmalonyl-CoA mutase family protein [Geminicoccaceae bacterium]|nr:methylmalonyl-CoA mutase family protein [Geminicoccaceae bacterium]
MEASAFEPLASIFAPADVDAWRKAALKAAGAGGLERLIRHTLDGIAIEPLYAPPLGNTVPDVAPAGGWPGAWTIAQAHRHPDPALANRAIRDDLANGADAALVRLDCALARGRSLPDGVLAYDRPALVRLLEGLPEPALFLECRERARELAALLPEAGVCILADPLGAALEGAAIEPEAELRDTLAAMRRDPRLRLLADGRPWHAAGASEAQELAGVLATWLHYLRALEGAGLALEEAAARLELVFAVDDDLFPSLAKIRAGRLLAERILSAAGIADPAGLVRIRAETGERMLAKPDPWVNILRTTVAAFAAVAGGADALTVTPFDRPLQEPSPLGRRLARNVQLVLREEAGTGRVRDPAAGSWYVAHLTRALAEAAFDRLRRIEEAGGAIAAARAGVLQREVAQTRARRARLLATRALELTGVSAFPTLEERAPPPPEPFDLAASLAAARAVLADRGTGSRASGIEPLPAIRLAEPFERLRARSDAATRATGARPSLPVLGIGRAGELHDLLTWVENLLAVGGIAAERLPAAEEPADLVRARGVRSLILCAGESAAARVPGLVAALRAAGVARLRLAGAVPEGAEGDERLAPGMDVLAFHEALHRELGIVDRGEGERS